MVVQEAVQQAERERHKKYRRQDEEREVVRQRIRDKYNIEKPEADDEEEEEDLEDSFSAGRKKETAATDPFTRESLSVKRQVDRVRKYTVTGSNRRATLCLLHRLHLLDKLVGT